MPTGPIDPLATDTLEVMWAGLEAGGFTGGTLASLADFDDARLAWIISDVLSSYRPYRTRPRR